MGDPECQTILPLLKSDLGEIILSCCNQSLSSQKIEWLYKKSLCIVLCSNCYPGEYKKKVIIKNTDNLNLQEGQYLIHAGTKYIDKDLSEFGSGGMLAKINAAKLCIQSGSTIIISNGVY